MASAANAKCFPLYFSSRSSAHLSHQTAGEGGRAPQLRGEGEPSTFRYLVQKRRGGRPAGPRPQRGCWEIHRHGQRATGTEKLYSGGGSTRRSRYVRNLISLLRWRKFLNHPFFPLFFPQEAQTTVTDISCCLWCSYRSLTQCKTLLKDHVLSFSQPPSRTVIPVKLSPSTTPVGCQPSLKLPSEEVHFPMPKS